MGTKGKLVVDVMSSHLVFFLQKVGLSTTQGLLKLPDVNPLLGKINPFTIDFLTFK